MCRFVLCCEADEFTFCVWWCRVLALGVLIGMIVCAHKTRKWKFWVFETLYLIWNAIILYAVVSARLPPFHNIPSFVATAPTAVTAPAAAAAYNQPTN